MDFFLKNTTLDIKKLLLIARNTILFNLFEITSENIRKNV